MLRMYGGLAFPPNLAKSRIFPLCAGLWSLRQHTACTPLCSKHTRCACCIMATCHRYVGANVPRGGCGCVTKLLLWPHAVQPSSLSHTSQDRIGPRDSDHRSACHLDIVGIGDPWERRGLGPGWECQGLGRGTYFCAKDVPPDWRKPRKPK